MSRADRDRRFVHRQIAALRADLPPGTEVVLSFCYIGDGAIAASNEGWRIAIRLPKEWAAVLDARITERHEANRFACASEWVRWPDGLSFGHGRTLRAVFVDARKMLDELRGVLRCPTCGRLPADVTEAAA